MKKLNVLKMLLLFGAFLSFSNCEKDEIISEAELSKESLEETIIPRAVYGSRNIWFNNWSSGQTYWYGYMTSDFGNVHGLSNAERDRQTIQNSHLKIKLEKNKLTGNGGVTAYVDLESSNEYTLEYKVKFDNGFQWKSGGKIPGLAGGAANTGCNKATGNGWSFRVMWRNFYTVNNNLPYLEPYVYYEGMPNDCGDNLNKQRYTIEHNKWYTIFLRVKMNTGSNSNGKIEMKVNGTTVYSNNSFKWVTSNSGRHIDRLLWNIYRGGASDSYKASEDNYIRIDNVKIKKL